VLCSDVRYRTAEDFGVHFRLTMAGTLPALELVLPDHAAWDLQQLVPMPSVWNSWKWEYGVTPLSNIMVRRVLGVVRI
jgi:hypothetical protein